MLQVFQSASFPVLVSISSEVIQLKLEAMLLFLASSLLIFPVDDASRFIPHSEVIFISLVLEIEQELRSEKKVITSTVLASFLIFNENMLFIYYCFINYKFAYIV